MSVVLLKEVLSETKDGDWGQGEPSVGLLPYSVIRATDFAEVFLGNVSTVPVRYLSERTVGRRTLQANDILIETAGGSPGRPTGRTMLLTDRVMSNFDGPVTCASFARFLRVDPAIANPHYVYWYLQDLYNSGAIEQYQIQHTGVARFQYTDFASTRRIVLPSSSTQRAISEVLGALDNKIAVNSRLGSAALSLAEALFQDLMNHDSGMPVRSIGSLMSLEYGKPLPATARARGGVEVYGSGGVVGWHDVALLPGPGVVVGRKGTAGSVMWASGPFYPIDTTFYVKPIEPQVSLPFCYFILRSLGLENRGSDSAVPGLNRNVAYAVDVKLPAGALIAEYTSKALGLFQISSQGRNEVSALSLLHDALLPELMSGKLRVKDAEKQVEAVV